MSMAISRASYTGDPGFFGDIFKGIKKVASVVLPFTPVGAAYTAGRQFLASRRQPPAPIAGPGSIDLSGDWAQVAQRYGITIAQAQRGDFPAGPGPVTAQRTMMGAPPPMMNGNGMASAGGYHLNKSNYFLMSGEFVPAGSKWVRNRKRNPANARATSRAISRITGAKNYAKSLGRISIRKKC